MDEMETAELLELFIQAARGYEDGLEHSSARKANRNTSIGERVVKELERRGAKHELLALLDDPVPIVRGFAATYALRFAPDAALPVLEDISENLRGVASWQAMTALMVWEEENNRD